MSRNVAIAATVFAVVFALGSAWFLFTGNHFFAGTLLTFVAFAIYIRETNLE